MARKETSLSMHSPRPTLSGPVHVFLHIMVVTLGWGIFGWSWWTVSSNQPFHPVVLATLITLTIIIVPLVTLVWVVHNREIYARKGKRLGGRSLPENYSQDWTGRLVHAQFESLRHAQRVIIDSTSDDKYFLTPADLLTAKPTP